jgi:hypothetical protein
MVGLMEGLLRWVDVIRVQLQSQVHVNVNVETEEHLANLVVAMITVFMESKPVSHAIQEHRSSSSTVAVRMEIVSIQIVPHVLLIHTFSKISVCLVPLMHVKMVIMYPKNVQ